MRKAYQFLLPQIKVHIDVGPLSVFDRHRQTRFYHREAGGQLFGSVGPRRWTVSHATGPNPEDRRFRFGFKPDRAREQAEIEDFHSRGFDYLGDWHTHPEDLPRPSTRDLSSIDEIVRLSRHHLPGFLLCIVGRRMSAGDLWLSFHSGNGDAIRADPIVPNHGSSG